jgi:hypothetical protein
MQLFQKSMHEEFLHRKAQIASEIERLPESELDANLSLIAENLVSEYGFPDAPEILGDQTSRDDTSFRERNAYCVVNVYIPFIGDGEMFRLYHSSCPLLEQSFSHVGQLITTQYDVYPDKIDDLPAKIEKTISFLNENLARVRKMVPKYNETLLVSAKDELERRQDKVRVKNKATRRLRELKIPIRRRQSDDVEVVIPVKRKPLAFPKLSDRKTKEQNYVLEMEVYEDVLKSIASMVLVIERSPSIFVHMDEEAIRTIILVNLNGIYEGQATGETFNGDGKTDILVRIENKNAFIAECLIWGGKQKLLEKMDDQLFKYATWRDTKLALVVFNRNKQFSHVLSEIHSTLQGHAQCLKEEVDCLHENAVRFRYRRSDDPQQHFTLTCIAFDVPFKEAKTTG